jgi:hypothetical protein
MRDKFFKPALVLLILLALVGAGFAQRALNRDRLALGLNDFNPIDTEQAPPVLAFTTVALGGFRGLIANALWIRANELQENDKFFEMVQLSDWITKLQPHFTTVWVHMAWNMAYNISIKFTDPRDRWQWVQRGIELLRDQGLKWNPKETLIYRELGWFFQHKMGQDLDDAHMYFKTAWANEMQGVLGTNYLALLNPQSDDEKRRAKRLREVFKMDPAIMQQVDASYGPLEWRLPESHAIYWATVGLKVSKREDLITLRREIYQPMQLAFMRGRLIKNKVDGRFQFGPNLAMIPNANKAYETMMAEDPEYRDHMKTGHRNFLMNAVYFLYTHARRTEAGDWFRYLIKTYPDGMFVGPVDRKVADMSLDEYCVARVTEDAGETSNTKTRSSIEGLLLSGYYYLGVGEDDQYTGLVYLAKRVWDRFMDKIGQEQAQRDRVGLPPFETMQREALKLCEEQFTPELMARVRTALNLPAPEASGTNAPPASATPR